MTTTLTKKNDASSKMSFFSGMESIGVKTVSILVILILNITTLSSQTNGMVCGSRLGIKSGSVPVKPKAITVYSVQKFPTLEVSDNLALLKMDESDSFDYEILFSSNAPAKRTTGPTSNPTQLTNIYNNNSNVKIAPKVN